MSRYDPDKYHGRSIRLRGYDYAQSGVYFLTVITHTRAHLFGEVVNSNGGVGFRLDHGRGMGARSPIAPICAVGCIRGDAKSRARNRLDCGGRNNGRRGAASLRPYTARRHHSRLQICHDQTHQPNLRHSRHARMAAQLLRAMRASRRIIRNERELNAIREYIRNNPTNWLTDTENV